MPARRIAEICDVAGGGQRVQRVRAPDGARAWGAALRAPGLFRRRRREFGRRLLSLQRASGTFLCRGPATARLDTVSTQSARLERSLERPGKDSPAGQSLARDCRLAASNGKPISSQRLDSATTAW